MASLMACLLIVAALLQGAVAQTSYDVGDTTGWTVPSTTTFYATWASGKTFVVGDTLVFNFQTGQHDVAQVSEADYASCTKTNTIGSVMNTGPANVTITSAGSYYYICTFGQHCAGGQKLAITAVSSNTTSPSPSTSPTTSPTTNPTQATPPTSASSASTVGGFSLLLLLSTAIAFFF